MNSIVDIDSIDTSNVVDIISQTVIPCYRLEPFSKILIDQNYECIELGTTIRVLLTKSCLVICDDQRLMFPAISVNRVQLRSTGAAQLEFLIDRKKLFSLKATSNDLVQSWSAYSAWISLEQSIQAQTRPRPIKTKDLFSFYNDPAGEISPIDSSDEEIEEKTYPSTATSSCSMNSSLPTTLPYSPVPPPLMSHTNIPEKNLPKTPPEKKSSFMRSVLSLGPRSRRSPVPNSNPSAVSINSSCSSSQSSLATPPISRSCSPAVHRYQNEQESTPPSSPDMQLGRIKRIVYQNEQCQVFHWKDESWYAANACILQVRETHGQQMCVTVQLKTTHEVYMNAWILPSLAIIRISDTDIGLTVKVGEGEEEYLLHCPNPEETNRLDQLLHQALESTEADLQLAMTCKCKLYLQSSSSKWRSFGTVQMNVSQHLKSKKMHMAIESHKGDKPQLLISAMVQSRNVERIGSKQISFLLTSDTTSRVYMVKVREESTGDKILEYLKEKNAELGW